VDQWGRDFPLREGEHERSVGDDSAKVSGADKAQAPAGEVSSAPAPGSDSAATRRTCPWTEDEKRLLHYAQMDARSQKAGRFRREAVKFIGVEFVLVSALVAMILQSAMTRYRISALALISDKDFWLGLFFPFAYAIAIVIGYSLAARYFGIWRLEYRTHRLLLDLACKTPEEKRLELQTAAMADKVNVERILDYARSKMKQAESHRYVSGGTGVAILAALVYWISCQVIAGQESKWIQKMASSTLYMIGLGCGVPLAYFGATLTIFSDLGMKHQVARLLLRFAGRSQYVPPD
jgi:hypothetical protein